MMHIQNRIFPTFQPVARKFAPLFQKIGNNPGVPDMITVGPQSVEPAWSSAPKSDYQFKIGDLVECLHDQEFLDSFECEYKPDLFLAAKDAIGKSFKVNCYFNNNHRGRMGHSVGLEGLWCIWPIRSLRLVETETEPSEKDGWIQTEFSDGKEWNKGGIRVRFEPRFSTGRKWNARIGHNSFVRGLDGWDSHSDWPSLKRAIEAQK